MTASNPARTLMLIAGLAILPSLALAQTVEDRTQDRVAFPSHKVIGNVYSVGTGTLNSFLFTTPQGHILVNTNFEETVPLLKEAVEKLGLKMTDIKIILGSHAHGDHMQGTAMVKEMTGGAQVVVMEQDVNAYKALKAPSGKAQPVDRVIKDGETVTLGGTTLTAHLTPGHTRGCTTWTATVPEGGRNYSVIIACGGLQEDARLVNNKNYPEIADHFAQAIKKYKTFKPDVFLASHAWFYDPAGKYARLQKGATPNPYIDPAGYQAWVANMEKNWNSLMAEQKNAPPPPAK
jgi:metallo-beta-lactamase class B